MSSRLKGGVYPENFQRLILDHSEFTIFCPSLFFFLGPWVALGKNLPSNAAK